MKLFQKAGIGVLSVMLGVPALVSAQDEPKREEPRPEQRAEQQDEAKPSKQEQGKPEAKQDEMKPPKESKPSKQEETKPSPGREGNASSAKPAGKSGHIPDNKFRANFGRAHTVVINHPTIVEGQPRFQYAGYWFIISDPWPGDWAYTDDCYIDYVDGEYFLFDLLHPGVQIALIVVM
jgi:hypothetical protein